MSGEFIEKARHKERLFMEACWPEIIALAKAVEKHIEELDEWDLDGWSPRLVTALDALDKKARKL